VNIENKNKVRIQKALSEQGCCSRRKAEEFISEGRVYINGKLAKLGDLVDKEKDILKLSGERVFFKAIKFKYYMFNKPLNCLVSKRSQGDVPTIFSINSVKSLGSDIKTVGRLDKQTQGLLLLANDGNFIHKLMHPSFTHTRVYRVVSKSKMSHKIIRQVNTEGVKLTDGQVKCSISFLGKEKSNSYCYNIEISQGRNRIVRRIFAALGCSVDVLIRVSFSGLRLPKNLKTGECRALSLSDMKTLGF
jgi:23S rRNA pseudouridine2605 synthase